MSCNAWNHPPGCDCGWGGRGHGGRHISGSSSKSGYMSSFDYFMSRPNEYRWRYHDVDFCRPTRCPVCGADVFFVRHNGGSVWFDALGKPWPKHACFDTGYASGSYYYSSARYGWNSTYGIHKRLLQYSEEQRVTFLGVVIEGELRPEQCENRIAFRAANGKIYIAYIHARHELTKLIGELILVSGVTRKIVFISLGEVVFYEKAPTPPPDPFLVGATYRHHTFGLGTLISVRQVDNDYRVVVDFDAVGRKLLLGSYAKLQLVTPLLP